MLYNVFGLGFRCFYLKLLKKYLTCAILLIVKGDFMRINKNKILNTASMCLNCKLHPCNNLCALKMPINEILQLIKNDNIEAAAKLIYENNCFPFVCGALCDHQRKCLGSCVLNKKITPVEYCDVEYSLGVEFVNLLFNKPQVMRDYKVAIIGGGICGMTVAIRLLNQGIMPVIYEKENNIGGVLSNSLPSFRYDTSTFNQVINYLNENIEIHYSKELGVNLFLEDLEEYHNIVFAYGAYIERTSFKESLKAISLLQDKEKLSSITNKDIIVTGCGNVAIDIARTLKRQNNNVTICYRRNIASSPAAVIELEYAINEGIKFVECISPTEIIKEGDQIKQVKFQKMELFDEGGSRLMFKPIDEFITIDTNLIVEAIGSSCDTNYLQSKLPELFNEKGWFVVNQNYQTCNSKYYVGGDLYTGPKDFCEAIKAGEVISKSIINFVQLHDLENEHIVIGGSFNPPTIAHQLMIKSLVELNPKKITIIPNGDQYKISFTEKNLIPFVHRKKMCELMTEDFFDNIEVSDIENQQEFKGSYYTLKSLNNPIFSMGSDCLYDLHKWINYENLVKENRFIIFTRNSDIKDMKNFIREDEFLKDYESHFIFLELDLPIVSSSKFRETKEANLLDEKVYKYIVNNKLFEV